MSSIAASDATRDADSSNGAVTAIWAVVATCGTYFCMYMFRKPFTAAKFENLDLWGVGYKSVLLIAQVVGYAISKFVGIRLVSGTDRSQRVKFLLILIAIAELALVGFGLFPYPWGIFWLFLNGLQLGVIFGLVLMFLEGRRKTEALAAGLCASFVFADGIAKSIGVWLNQHGVSDGWMPACAGMIFIVPMAFFCWMLSQIPNPDAGDVIARSERPTMNGDDRKRFFSRFAFGLSLLLLIYGVVGILRGVRGDFAPEIWSGLGAKVDAGIFARTEILTGAAVLVVFAVVSRIRDNFKAFSVGIISIGVGCGTITLSVLGRQAHFLSPFEFMVLNGIGLYLPYFAVHTTLFERLIAFTRERGNIGYLMYLADSGSYAGYVGVLLFRSFTKPKSTTFIAFFEALSWGTVLICLLSLVPTAIYFRRQKATI